MASALAVSPAVVTGYHHDNGRHPEPSDELRYTLECYEGPSQALSPPEQYTTSLTTSDTQGYSSGYLTYLTDQKTFEALPGTFGGAQLRTDKRCLPIEPSTSLESFEDVSQASCYNTQPPGRSSHMRSGGQSTPLGAVMRQLQDINPELANSLKQADSHLSKGQVERAMHALEQSLIQASGYPRLQCVIWMLLGGAHMQQRAYKKASMCYLRYMELCRELQDFQGTTRAECKLGISYLKQGLLKLAGRCFSQYLENSTISQNDIGIAAACSNLGIVSRLLAVQDYKAHMKEGETRQAEEVLSSHMCQAVVYFQQHLAIVEHYGDLEKQARAYGNLGSCYQLLKQYTQAVHCHNKRLSMVRILGDKVSECCTLCNLGNCYRATSRLQEALEYYHLGYELCQLAGNQRVEMVTLLNLGTTCELVNKLSKAIEWYTLYLSMTVLRGDLRGQAKGLATLTALYEATRQVRKAQEYTKKLGDVFRRLGSRDPKMSATRYLHAVRQRIASQRKHCSKTDHVMSHASGHSNGQLAAQGGTATSKRAKADSWTHGRQPSHAPQSTGHTHYPSHQLVFENPLVHEAYSRTESEITEQVHLSSHMDQTPTTSPDSSVCFPYSYESSQYSSSDNEDYRGSSDYPPPLPPRRYSLSDLSDEGESTTDYESIPDLRPRAPVPSSIDDSAVSSNSGTLSTCSSELWESIEDLQGVQDLTPNSGGSMMEVDKEWEQWINLRSLNALSRVVSMSRGEMRARGHKIAAVKPSHSAPQVDLGQPSEEYASTVCSDSSLAI